MPQMDHDFIDASKIGALLDSKAPDKEHLLDILQQARDLAGLTINEVASLLSINEPQHLDELFDAAQFVKNTIYGKRLVLFAPLYVSNYCSNECLYCAFRSKNHGMVRLCLSQPQVKQETEQLIMQGHKRVLLVAGESYNHEGKTSNLDYIADCIDTIYNVTVDFGSIRRININIAPLTSQDFRLLKNKNIGTYQLFQETYHQPTYKQVHLAGKKKDYSWRLTAMHRAIEAGLDDVGIGVLFGLYDWRFEVLAMMQHIAELEGKFGIGPHTISVPRLEPADHSLLAMSPPHPVADLTFKKIIAILRLAIPYTGIILSTRENPIMRQQALALGVSQLSAGSRTQPGGYSDNQHNTKADESISPGGWPAIETEQNPVGGQFCLGDHRSLGQVIQDIIAHGFIPSFCTACYRLGRTGADFMDLAKPGDIKSHCDPNGLVSFSEYLLDYADESTQKLGKKAIDQALSQMDESVAKSARRMIAAIHNGKRDIYC